MRVVQINAVDSVLSTGRTSKELAEYLIKKGIECRVYVGDGQLREPYDFLIGNKLDHKVHALLSRITGTQGYFSQKATRKLVADLILYNPDIVHLRNLHANYINLPILLKYLAEYEVPTVITLHDCFMFTGRCFYPSDVNCNKWKTSCNDCKLKHAGNNSWFFDQSHKMFEDKKKYLMSNKYLAVTGVSRWITEQAQESFLKDCAEIKEIYNWIDLDIFYPRIKNNIRDRYGIDTKPIILGVATNWNQTKGLDDFVHLADKMSDQANVVLIGRIPDIYNTGKVLSIGLTDSVNTLAEFYSEASVFFNPSRRETFGKVTAEALACGCPVVVYDNTALPELVGERCGYVVETGNINKAQKQIEDILHNGKEAYTEYCINHVKKNFDKKTNIEKILEIYHYLSTEKDEFF